MTYGLGRGESFSVVSTTFQVPCTINLYVTIGYTVFATHVLEVFPFLGIGRA